MAQITNELALKEISSHQTVHHTTILKSIVSNEITALAVLVFKIILINNGNNLFSFVLSLYDLLHCS